MKLILGKSELVLAVLCVTLLRSQRMPIWRHFSLHYLKLAPFLFESSTGNNKREVVIEIMQKYLDDTRMHVHENAGVYKFL